MCNKASEMLFRACLKSLKNERENGIQLNKHLLNTSYVLDIMKNSEQNKEKYSTNNWGNGLICCYNYGN